MHSRLSRRQFILRSTIALAAGPTLLRPRMLWADDAAASADKPLYAFPLLGDIHYDLMSHHDMDWVNREKPDDIRQIQGYVDSSIKYTPKLLQEIRQVIAGIGAPVPFVIQVGDLVEGLCGSYELQALQFKDTFDLIASSDLGAPFLITKGNHDITGPGAPEAYDQVLLPWLSGQAKQHLTRADYHFKQGEDLFVFFDAYKPDLDWLEGTLRDNPARHVFFVIHPPVVPYNARAEWTIYGRQEEAASRERLLNLLGQYKALVLSGHLHKYSLLARETPQGRFAQLAVLSVLRGEDPELSDVLEGDEHYGPDLCDLEPRHSPKTLDRRRAVLEAEKPFISGYEFANIPGYAVLKVYADRVETDVYLGLGQERWKTRDLLATRSGQPVVAG